MRKSEIVIIAIIVVSLVLGFWLYPRMPENMASHWNVRGEVDDYMSKFWGLFLLPFVAIGILLLFILIPKIDPLKANIEKFRKYYDTFLVCIIVFLFYIYVLTLLWNLNVKFDMNQLLPPAMGLLFFYAGILTENAKMNWFIGIRTPWTLSSENVWDKTHKIGGKLFKIAGIIAFLSLFFPKYSLFLILVPILVVVVYVVVYSYFEYQKEKK